MWKSARLSDNTFEDIPPSKVVLYYEAKACYRHVCKDLSGNIPGRHGRFTGHKIYTWDVKVQNYKFEVSYLIDLWKLQLLTLPNWCSYRPPTLPTVKCWRKVWPSICLSKYNIHIPGVFLLCALNIKLLYVTFIV